MFKNNLKNRFVIIVSSLFLLSLGGFDAEAANVISTGTYSEDANSDDAPISRSDMAGNIKKMKISQTTDGSLSITIDYWALPNNHYILGLRWCTYIDEFRHNAWTGEDLSFLCDVSDPNWRNYVVYFEPALSSKGNQLGLRSTFKGTSKKGANKNQWVYTIKGNLFRSSVIVGVEASTSYSSDTVERVTTTCSGSYSITCSTSRSSLFDVDEVLVEMSQISAPAQPATKASPTPTPKKTSTSTTQDSPLGATKTIQDYFDRIQGQFNPNTRQFQVECINDAPRSGSVSKLRALLAISSNTLATSPGKSWFPTKFTPEYASRIKTWTANSSDQSHLYIELEFSAINANPCGMIFQNVPRLSEIGSDVNSATFLVAGSTGYAVASTNYSKSQLGG